MDIVIIGTGNTASVLGRKLRQAGHSIVQVFGRDTMAASELAYELDSESTNYWNIVTRDADIYLLAVSDIAIDEVVNELHLQGKTVVHTAASVSKDIFKDRASHFGVFYPLQSLKKNMLHLPEIPIVIDASDANTLEALDQLAHTISTQVVTAGDDERVKLHLAAVFVNNFVNHIYALAEQYCAEEGIDFQLLLPLIRETAEGLREIPASAAQTGPAVRNDRTTIEKHLALLEKHTQMKKVYQALTESIYNNR